MPVDILAPKNIPRASHQQISYVKVSSKCIILNDIMCSPLYLLCSMFIVIQMNIYTKLMYKFVKFHLI